MSKSAEAKAQTRNYNTNAYNAGRAFEIESNQLTNRQIQEQDQTAAKKANYQREFETARAGAINKASEAGVSGLSFEALMGDLSTQQGSRIITADSNLEDVTQQLQFDKQGQSTNMINRINSMQKGKKPNVLELGLGIASSALGGFSAYSKQNSLGSK